MDREHLLPDRGDRLAVLVIEREVQPDDVAPELPVQALDVGDVAEDMEQLVRERDLPPVVQGDVVLFVQTDRLFLEVRHLRAARVEQIGLPAQGKHRGFRPVQELSLLVPDGDLLMQIAGIELGIERTGRSAEALKDVLVRALARAVESLDVRKNTHDRFSFSSVQQSCSVFPVFSEHRIPRARSQ